MKLIKCPLKTFNKEDNVDKLYLQRAFPIRIVTEK